MKSPDEIKKGLRHCSEYGCKGCPYKEDCDMADGFSVLAYDALAYIQQLEEREWDFVQIAEGCALTLNMICARDAVLISGTQRLKGSTAMNPRRSKLREK